MTIKIQHKRSAVKDKAPLPADLEYGEIAVNYEATDPALYVKDSADAIRKIGEQPAATEAAKGIVELATAAETTTGTDATRAVHPAGLKVELDKKVDLAGGTMTGNLTVPSLNGGQLAGFRNVLINGSLLINQRAVTIAAAAVGQYGPDRWKKVDAGHMTQIVEAGNFEPGATYTLSGTGVTTQQLVAPATGNWTLLNIPIAATKIQLEPGPVATPFERRPIGMELALCQRYYQHSTAVWSFNGQYSALSIPLRPVMRVTPTIVLKAVGGTAPVNSAAYLGLDVFRVESSAACDFHWTVDAEL